MRPPKVSSPVIPADWLRVLQECIQHAVDELKDGNLLYIASTGFIIFVSILAASKLWYSRGEAPVSTKKPRRKKKSPPKKADTPDEQQSLKQQQPRRGRSKKEVAAAAAADAEAAAAAVEAVAVAEAEEAQEAAAGEWQVVTRRKSKGKKA